MASHGYEKQTKPKLVKVEHAAGHQLGMRVPKGGSDCEKCKYVRPEQKCSNAVFIRWKGDDDIPAAIDEYCCDEFKEKT